jgi:hypothetical protein
VPRISHFELIIFDMNDHLELAHGTTRNAAQEMDISKTGLSPNLSPTDVSTRCRNMVFQLSFNRLGHGRVDGNNGLDRSHPVLPLTMAFCIAGMVRKQVNASGPAGTCLKSRTENSHHLIAVALRRVCSLVLQLVSPDHHRNPYLSSAQRLDFQSSLPLIRLLTEQREAHLNMLIYLSTRAKSGAAVATRRPAALIR